VMGTALLVFVQLCGPTSCPSQHAGTVQGLWRLAGVMPAGAPTQEIPKGPKESYLYWFNLDGTVILMQETEEGKSILRGAWKENQDLENTGYQVVITWENGSINTVRVVKIMENYMILTGLGVAPMWFRFVRYF